jgi:ABC-type polysaccharide/polyol phosphate export permease
MRYSKLFRTFNVDIISNCRLLWELTKKDFKTRYIGSYLGILWAFIQPIITVFIFWFVFQVGFKSMPVDNFPFILWLICGMFPWFFFSEALNSATSSIISNSYLVKKVVFRVSLLPMVQIISALIVHAFFICGLFFMFLVYGYIPNLYTLQVFYYLFALICFTFGLSLITSSLIIFLKDVGQIIAMILQFGFWATPIFWSLKLIPEQYHWIFKCNPMFYIVEGYRNSFIYHKWFWELGYTNIGFWLITCLVLFGGIIIFKKLRPHFADVL